MSSIKLLKVSKWSDLYFAKTWSWSDLPDDLILEFMCRLGDLQSLQAMAQTCKSMSRVYLMMRVHYLRPDADLGMRAVTTENKTALREYRSQGLHLCICCRLCGVRQSR
jgi:hypothetical protein